MSIARGESMRTRLVGLLVLVVAVAPATARAQDTDLAWEEASALQEEIYVEEVAIDADGDVVSAMTAGSLVIELDSGEEFVLDLEDLADPDGNQYFIDGGASQLDELDPVTYTFRVVRYVPTEMSDEEVLESWSEVHDDASEEELQRFLTEREQSATPPSLARYVDPDLLDWLDAAEDDETIDVVMILSEQPTLELPKAPNALLAKEPAFWFEAMEQRLLAIEDRKTEVASLQAELVADIEQAGGEVLTSAWLHNSLSAQVPPALLDALVDDPRVHSLAPPMVVSEAALPEPWWNDFDGEDAREATQTWLFLEEGYDGSHGPPAPYGNDHVYVLIADSYIDEDHPAWDTWDGQSYVSRCLGSYVWNGSQWNTGSNQSANPYGNHGNYVAAALLADLTQGQDPGNPALDSDERAGITGIATSPVFSFVEYQGSFGGFDFTRYIEQAISLNVDLVHFSIGGVTWWDAFCDVHQYDHEALVAVNDAMDHNIFVVHAAGNFGNGYSGSPCTVWNPGGASGAFVVGGLDRKGDEANPVTDLDTTEIWNGTKCTGPFPPDPQDDPHNWECGSGRGGDVYGRPLVKTVTAGGRGVHPADYDYQDPYSPPPFLLWPMYQDCVPPMFGTHIYWPTASQNCALDGGGGYKTSYAAPIATGAAADLLDFFVQSPNMPFPHYLDEGHLFSHMLLMGDGHLEGDGVIEGGTQGYGTPIDEVYGAGRLRMRLFTERGMDAPWRWRFVYWVEDQDELFTYPVHEIGGSLAPVPVSVDWFRAALWFHEPNINLVGNPELPIPTSSVRLSIYHNRFVQHWCDSTVPQSQRLWMDDAIANQTWTVRVKGLNIPASVDPDYFHNKQKRGMYLAFYWEDRARNDASGPFPADDIY